MPSCLHVTKLSLQSPLGELYAPSMCTSVFIQRSAVVFGGPCFSSPAAAMLEGRQPMPLVLAHRLEADPHDRCDLSCHLVLHHQSIPAAPPSRALRVRMCLLVQCTGLLIMQAGSSHAVLGCVMSISAADRTVHAGRYLSRTGTHGRRLVHRHCRGLCVGTTAMDLLVQKVCRKPVNGSGVCLQLGRLAWLAVKLEASRSLLTGCRAAAGADPLLWT